ncbi:immunoglobulin domain-containing protein [Parapedobacter sp. DT-150]|uniref:immunoglobulin domain-containing protein n=1 Tax=Parapedobacter sp. DT-150 TaxID=3396162 RepID=UPI003F541687
MLRLFAAFALLLFGVVKDGYGQRVYANAQQTSVGSLGGSVQNPTFASDTNYTNYSTLRVGVGLLNLMHAMQNLQFSGTPYPKPSNTSPIMIRFSSAASIANLVGGLSIIRTNNGINNLVGTEYTSTSLLTLLNGSVESEVIIPIPSSTATSDGLRLRIATLAGAALSANLYYAFYIKPPNLSQSTVTVCPAEPAQLTISNLQNNYTYRLYSAQTGGSEITGVTRAGNALSIPSPPSPGTYTYWLEAREGDLYPSARTAIQLTVVPKPPAPNVQLTPNSQY